MDFPTSKNLNLPASAINVNGIQVFKGFLDRKAQVAMVTHLRDVAMKAPFFSPETPSGKRMSVRMTAAGRFGWFSDQSGYRYATQHPNGSAWPDIPQPVLDVWREVTVGVPDPECCLINYYGDNTKMGLHQDRDEANFDWPVVSISLGDDALLRVGGPERGGKTQSIWLGSGDVAVMAGAARLHYHGIDRIKFGSSQLLPKGGRINLTLRVVT
ncbi:MAG: alpha-ketoglutarate-dependent dioxygenase AlkB family protein [Planktomarina sp.]